MKKVKKVIAIDLGGTNLRVSLVRNNKIIKYIKKKTPNNKKDLLQALTETIKELMDEDIRGIGVSSAGPLIDGVIKNPPNLPLKNFDLEEYLRRKFKKKVVVENDANCVAIAERELGCRKKNFFILTIGTGIGGGVIVDGKLYSGCGYAAELGHIVIREKDFEQVWKEDKKVMRKYFGKDLLVRDLFQLKNKGCKRMLEKIADDFGKFLGSLINIFDPEVVILAGGIRETGDKFLNLIKRETKKYVIIPRVAPIKWSSLDHPGTLGASLLID